jgi:hypothetical protein
MPFYAVAMAVSLLAGQTAGASYDPCLSSEECSDDGRCSSFGGQCVVMSEADCEHTDRCKEKGMCTADENECVARREDDCLRSKACREEGLCYFDPKEQVCDDGKDDNNKGLMIGGFVMIRWRGAHRDAGRALRIDGRRG